MWHTASCRHILLLSFTYRLRLSNHHSQISDKTNFEGTLGFYSSHRMHLKFISIKIKDFILAFLKTEFSYGVNFICFSISIQRPQSSSDSTNSPTKTPCTSQPKGQAPQNAVPRQLVAHTHSLSHC